MLRANARREEFYYLAVSINLASWRDSLAGFAGTGPLSGYLALLKSIALDTLHRRNYGQASSSGCDRCTGGSGTQATGLRPPLIWASEHP